MSTVSLRRDSGSDGLLAASGKGLDMTQGRMGYWQHLGRALGLGDPDETKLVYPCRCSALDSF